MKRCDKKRSLSKLLREDPKAYDLVECRVRIWCLSMDRRENYLRTVEMRGPEWIPCSIALTPLVWHTYREKLEDLVLRHPSIFDKHERGSHNFDDFGIRRKGNVFTDEWGCVWHFLKDGLQGQVMEHPLED